MHEERIDILVVDDDEINQEIYARVLARLPQVSVHVASSGFDALDKVAEGGFGLVLLDIMMPGMDGYETARAMRKLLGEKTPPIIFITAYGKDESDQIKGFEEGAVDLLFKPYDLKLLEKKAKVFVDMELGRRALERAFTDQQRQAEELSALLQGARAILKHTDFPVAARHIFDQCRNITGATAGYVALLSEDGQENEVLFLESGGRDCTVDQGLPMPIRGLRGVVYRDKRTVVENDFTHSEWMRFMPAGHVSLDNVMFAPLIIDDRVVGVLGLANKPGRFSEHDEKMATAFGELAAVSLSNTRTRDILHRTTRLMHRGQQIAHLGSFEWDTQEGRFYCSQEMAVVLGHGSADSLSMGQLSEHVHPDDRAKLKAVLRSAGSEGGPVDLDFRILDGDAVRMVQLQADTGQNEAGREIVIGTCQDITARRELEQRAVVTQKLDALGQLAGGLAHELNTPLQYIISNLDFIESSWKAIVPLVQACERLAGKAGSPGLEEEVLRIAEQARGLGLKDILSDIPEAVADSRGGVDKVSFILGCLRRFSRVTPEGEACCDLNKIVEDAVALTGNHWRDVAELSLDLSSDLPSVVCMPRDISHCLLNLILNAAQAIRAKFGKDKSKGRIDIRTGMDDGQVTVTVEDDGMGIPEEHQGRVFEPFFTTRVVGEGTGMGLAVARTVIRAHGGELHFVSRPGEGTVFSISLPVGNEFAMEED